MDLRQVDIGIAFGLGVFDLRHVGPRFLAPQTRHQLGQMRHRLDDMAVDQLRLDRAGARYDDRGGTEGVDQREHTDDLADRAVEAELTEEADVAYVVRRELLGGDQNADRHGEIECGTALAQARRCEVDRVAALEPGQSTRLHGRPHAVARLATGAVGLTDDREPGQATRNVDLDRDGPTIDPEQCRRMRSC